MKFYLAAIFLTIVLNFYVKSSFGFYFGDSTKTECSCTCGDGKICAKTKLILFNKCQCQEGFCPDEYKFSGKHASGLKFRISAIWGETILLYFKGYNQRIIVT